MMNSAEEPRTTIVRNNLAKCNHGQLNTLVTIGSFLPIRDDFHPRRNQARQKLATLQSTRFKDLASDVYHELKRRYPHVLNIDEQLPPLPRSKETQGLPSQSTNIIPVKGMMSVESINLSDDEGDGQPPLMENGNNQSLDSLMADLGNMVRTPQPLEKHKFPEVRKKIQAQNFSYYFYKSQDLQYEYERKIDSMAKRIKMLELALDNVSGWIVLVFTFILILD